MKTKKQKFIWAVKTAWWNKHNLVTSVLNFFLTFICDAYLGWYNEGWNDEKNEYSYKRKIKWYRRYYGKDVKPKFGLIRISRSKFLREALFHENTWLCYKKRNGKWKFNKYVFYHIRHKIDRVFMKELYVPFYHWYRYLQYAKEAAETEVSQYICLSDPMNGCAGDFAEDFSRRNYRDESYSESLKCPEWFKRRIYSYYNKKAWDEYYKNPAPWDDVENDEDFKNYYEKTINQ